MARQLRIQYPGAFYHVTSRGNDRKEIFREEEDYELFLERLAESLEVYNVSLLGYVCMTNHFHLLLTTPDGNLSDFMRHFNIGYTGAFNRKYNRSGHLYQGRFKSFLIQKDEYLKEVSRYIHLNPVRIKKYTGKDFKEKSSALNKFRFNSFGGYTNLRKRDEFVNYSTVLDYFGGDTQEGRRQYRQFVLSGLTGLASPLDLGRGNGIIGSEGFIERIREKYLTKFKPEDQREQPHLKEVKKKFQPEELIKAFCRALDIERESVCTKGKNSIERAILMELLYRHCKITQPEIGRIMGGIDYSAISYARKRLRQKIENEDGVKALFLRIEGDLSSLKI